MDTRVKPEYDDVTGVLANPTSALAALTTNHSAFSRSVETSPACAARSALLETSEISDDIRPVRHSRAEQGAERRAQTLESMPRCQGVAAVTEFCTVAFCGRGHGMDTRVKPEYDNVTGVSANLRRGR